MCTGCGPKLILVDFTNGALYTNDFVPNGSVILVCLGVVWRSLADLLVVESNVVPFGEGYPDIAGIGTTLLPRLVLDHRDYVGVCQADWYGTARWVGGRTHLAGQLVSPTGGRGTQETSPLACAVLACVLCNCSLIPSKKEGCASDSCRVIRTVKLNQTNLSLRITMVQWVQLDNVGQALLW